MSEHYFCSFFSLFIRLWWEEGRLQKIDPRLYLNTLRVTVRKPFFIFFSKRNMSCVGFP